MRCLKWSLDEGELEIGQVDGATFTQCCSRRLNMQFSEDLWL